MTPSMQELIDHCEQKGLDQHPFLRQLQSEPTDLGKIYDIMSNAQAFAASFAPWLAALIARLDDPRIRCLVAKQLNDELGNGDFSRIHTVLYKKMLASLSPWKPLLPAGVSLAPGKKLQEDAAKYFSSEDPYEALGAMIAGEIYASQFNMWLGGEFARQRELDLGACDWYNVHAELEVEHAQDSTRIAELIPDSEAHHAAVWRGARGMDKALRSFLDSIQQR